MHNGGIAEFEKIKRKLQVSLSDELFLLPQGNTGESRNPQMSLLDMPEGLLQDSEWAFALYLSKLPDVHAREFSPAVLRDAVLDTIAHLNTLAREANITEVRMNYPPR